MLKWRRVPVASIRRAMGDGRWTVAAALLCLSLYTGLAASNAPAGPDEIPPLRPPKPELSPGFWEQHGVLVCLTGLVIALILLLLWRMLSRPTPPVIPLPAAVARQALEPLRHRTEDAELFTEVSGVLRSYFPSALGIAHQEFTNIELCAQLESRPELPPALATSCSELLRGMEHQRFAAGLNTGDGQVVRRALALIDRTETALHPEPEKGSADQPPP